MTTDRQADRGVAVRRLLENAQQWDSLRALVPYLNVGDVASETGEGAA